MHKATLRRVRVTIVAMEKQRVLHIYVCVRACGCGCMGAGVRL